MNKTQIKIRKEEIKRAYVIGVLGISMILFAAYLGFFEAIIPFRE